MSGKSGNAALSRNTIGQRVLAEQTRLLYAQGKPGSYTFFIGIAAVGVVMSSAGPAWPAFLMIAVQVAAQTTFNLLRRAYRADPAGEAGAEKWAKRYANACILSGSTWAAGAICWFPLVPFPYQAFFAFIVALLGLTSFIQRLSYPRAFYTYAAASALPTLVMLALFGGTFGLLLVALSLLTAAALLQWMRLSHASNGDGIRLHFENAALAERLERAHRAAEQKRRDAEEAHRLLRASEKTRRDFLAVISQGMRAPLDALEEAASTLETGLPESEEVRTLKDSHRMMKRLFADVTDLAEMETRSIAFKNMLFDPRALTEQVLRLVRNTQLKPGLSAEVDWGNDVPREMVGDRDRLQQALTNIAAYLLAGTDKGGIVLQAASSSAFANDAVRFSVTSTSYQGSVESVESLAAEAPLSFASTLMEEETLGFLVAKRLAALMSGEIGVDAAPGAGITIWLAVPKHPGLALRAPGEGENDDDCLVDLARLYMLEDRMGTDAFVAHLQRALSELRDHWAALADAAHENDRASLTAAARRLADSGHKLGFTSLADEARNLSLAPPGAEGPGAHMPRLETRLLSSESMLKRVYPRLSA